MNIQEERQAPAKINLLLNILGRGDDGYHELESLMIPIPLYDILHFRLDDSLSDLRLSIPQNQLNPGADNLVMRAAKAFLKETRMDVGLHIELIKKIPMEAGLGGGSSDAAITLKTLNHCFGKPLSQKTLHTLASQLGSDVPFFLEEKPMLVKGRGEQLQSIPPLRSLDGAGLLLIKPPFGVSTAWAYQELARFPGQLHGQEGRARAMAEALSNQPLADVSEQFYNSLESPVLEKFPLLKLFQESLREWGAVVTLMSGSGSTTFALFENLTIAQKVAEKIPEHFGGTHWISTMEL